MMVNLPFFLDRRPPAGLIKKRLIDQFFFLYDFLYFALLTRLLCVFSKHSYKLHEKIRHSLKKLCAMKQSQ